MTYHYSIQLLELERMTIERFLFSLQESADLSYLYDNTSYSHETLYQEKQLQYKDLTDMIHYIKHPLRRLFMRHSGVDMSYNYGLSILLEEKNRLSLASVAQEKLIQNPDISNELRHACEIAHEDLQSNLSNLETTISFLRK